MQVGLDTSTDPDGYMDQGYQDLKGNDEVANYQGLYAEVSWSV